MSIVKSALERLVAKETASKKGNLKKSKGGPHDDHIQTEDDLEDIEAEIGRILGTTLSFVEHKSTGKKSRARASYNINANSLELEDLAEIQAYLKKMERSAVIGISSRGLSIDIYL